jgi:hypothetical protein
MKLANDFDQTAVETRLNYVIESSIPTILFPIISKGDDWVRVNDILITKYNDSYKVKRKGVEIAQFQKRAWAVAYAVAICQSNYELCNMLKIYNVKLEKYTEEIQRYSYHLDIAKETKNVFKENIISDRLSRTISEYTFILDELSPLIKSQSEV